MRHKPSTSLAISRFLYLKWEFCDFFLLEFEFFQLKWNFFSLWLVQLAVAQKFNIADVAQMNLFLNGQPMHDEQMLSNYNVSNQSTIDMDIGLVGGKVHGSLARAGKVKGQTPKVWEHSCLFRLDILCDYAIQFKYK